MKIKNKYFAWLIFAIVASCSSTESKRKITENCRYPYSVIKNKNILYDSLQKAVSALDSLVNESAIFWKSVGADTSYSKIHRGICLMQLFKRHIQPGMLLENFRDTIGSANWQHTEITLVSTRIERKVVTPNNWRSYIGRRFGNEYWNLHKKVSEQEGALYYLRFFPGLERAHSEVYFGLSKKLNCDSLKAYLLNNIKYKAADHNIVIGICALDNYDDDL
jgi:hypothetical protein